MQQSLNTTSAPKNIIPVTESGSREAEGACMHGPTPHIQRLELSAIMGIDGSEAALDAFFLWGTQASEERSLHDVMVSMIMMES